MPKYSVIVPVYNVEKFLPACLDSVLLQDTASEFEIIAVDDGSTDASGAVCDNYASRYPQLRVLHTKNGGVSAARNLGIAAATGQYLLFLDGDDLWKPGLLSALDALSNLSPAVMTFGFLRLTEAGRCTPCARDMVIPAGENGNAYLHVLLRAGGVLKTACWSYCIRRDLLCGIEFRKDLQASEDFDFVMRVLEAAPSVVGTGEALYIYRVRPDSASRSLTEKKLMDNLTCKAYYYKKVPCAALANLYADNALLIGRLPRANAASARTFLKENRGIWRDVSQPPLKLGRGLTALLGDYWGARVYVRLRAAARRMRRAEEI